MKEASKIALADGCYVDDGNNVAGADDGGGEAGLDDAAPLEGGVLTPCPIEGFDGHGLVASNALSGLPPPVSGA